MIVHDNYCKIEWFKIENFDNKFINFIEKVKSTQKKCDALPARFANFKNLGVAPLPRDLSNWS